MNSPKVNVWYAMSNNQIIGPYFLEDETANQQNYLQVLRNYLYPILQRKRFNNKMIFHQDGVPPHFSEELRIWLNEKFNRRWIGRGGSISCAARSPDLVPLDFSLGRYIKTKVYKTKVNDTADLKEKME